MPAIISSNVLSPASMKVLLIRTIGSYWWFIARAAPLGVAPMPQWQDALRRYLAEKGLLA